MLKLDARNPAGYIQRDSAKIILDHGFVIC